VPRQPPCSSRRRCCHLSVARWPPTRRVLLVPQPTGRRDTPPVHPVGRPGPRQATTPLQGYTSARRCYKEGVGRPRRSPLARRHLRVTGGRTSGVGWGPGAATGRRSNDLGQPAAQRDPLRGGASLTAPHPCALGVCRASLEAAGGGHGADSNGEGFFAARSPGHRSPPPPRCHSTARQSPHTLPPSRSVSPSPPPVARRGTV